MSPFDQYLGFFEREVREDRKGKRGGWREGGREGRRVTPSGLGTCLMR